jgi:predicted PurR-regulated permease PerM
VVPSAESRFSGVLFYGFVLCLAYFVFRIFQPFLVPLGWAAVFGVIFYSLNKRFERKWGRTQSAVLITLGVTLILIVPVLLLAALFVREGISAARDIQEAMEGGGYGWFSRTWAWLATHIAAGGITVDLPALVRAARAGESGVGVRRNFSPASGVSQEASEKQKRGHEREEVALPGELRIGEQRHHEQG